jgi:DNA-binding transcriptional regulator/RsmH inhibitor MraZ
MAVGAFLLFRETNGWLARMRVSTGEALRPAQGVETLSQGGSFISFATSFLDGKERFSLPATLRNTFFGGRDDVKKLNLRLDDDRPMIEAFDDNYIEDMRKRLNLKFESAESRGEDFALSDKIARYTSAVLPVSIDSAGRFSLPPRMQKYTRIADAIVIEGAGSVMRIWAPEDFLEQADLHRMVRDEGEEFLAEVQARRARAGTA